MSEIKKDGNSATVIPSEDIMSSNRDELRDELIDLINDGTVRLILDLKNVNRIDSSGLSVFIAAYNSLKNNEGVLELTNANDNIKKLLTLTRLDLYVMIA
jgi:anti-sigma B factor antagonist